MEFEKKYEQQYESWKRRRADTNISADFADRVMASVCGASVRGRWMWLRRVKTRLSSSTTLQAAAYVAAAAFLLLRLAALFAIFLPSG
jgi:hypothetical protein